MVYVLMALLGLGGVIFTVIRRRKANDKAGLVAVYLVAWGLISAAEWFAHSIFNLYRYHTGLSLNTRYDTAWGVLLGEFTFLPSLNVLLVAYFRPWLGALVGTVIVEAMERIYIPLGLFSYNGWQWWMTPVTFPFYFGACSLYWGLVRRHGAANPILLPIARYLGLLGLTTGMSLGVWAFRLSETDLRLVDTTSGNESFSRIVVHGLGVLLGFWALFPQRWSERWGRIALVTVGQIIVTDAARAFGLLYFIRPMSGVLDAAFIGGGTILMGVIQNWIVHHAALPGERRVPAWEPPKV
ncbi:MAG: hypothetical protein ACM3XM_16915 [Mycobacterium leprae]